MAFEKYINPEIKRIDIALTQCNRVKLCLCLKRTLGTRWHTIFICQTPFQWKCNKSKLNRKRRYCEQCVEHASILLTKIQALEIMDTRAFGFKETERDSGDLSDSNSMLHNGCRCIIELGRYLGQPPIPRERQLSVHGRI